MPLFKRCAGSAMVRHLSCGGGDLSFRRRVRGRVPQWIVVLASLPSRRGIIKRQQLLWRLYLKARGKRKVLSGNNGETVCDRLCCYRPIPRSRLHAVSTWCLQGPVCLTSMAAGPRTSRLSKRYHVVGCYSSISVFSMSEMFGWETFLSES